MIAYQGLDCSRIEDAGGGDSVRRQRIEQQLAQRAAEPVVCGNVEAALLAVEHGVGQAAAHQLLEQELGVEAAHLVFLRERGGEFDDAVIQERRPHLERVRHAHAIALIQDVVGQIVMLIDEQVPVQVTDARRTRGNAVDEMTRVVSVAEGADLLPLGGGESAVPEEMRLVGMEA